MKILLTLLLTVGTLSAADVRVVNNIRVDLQPVHDWFKSHEGQRPMPHWKKITIIDFIPGGPWPICKISGEISKTVYMKNLPIAAIQYWNQFNYLTTRIGNLKFQIEDDKKRLRQADAVEADYGSEYDQNREQFRANLRNNEDDLESLKRQLDDLKAQQKESISDFAMFTGQVYNNYEVWDCGLKTQ